MHAASAANTGILRSGLRKLAIAVQDRKSHVQTDLIPVSG